MVPLLLLSVVSLCQAQPALVDPLVLTVSVTVSPSSEADAASAPVGFWYQRPLACPWQRLEGEAGAWCFATLERPAGEAPVAATALSWQASFSAAVFAVDTRNAAAWEPTPLATDDPAAVFLDPASEEVAWVVGRDPNLDQATEDLAAAGGTMWDRARRAWEYVKENHSEYGKCYVRSSLFCVLLRRQGIPARLIGGLCSRRWEHHVWAEYYLPGYGWAPVEWIPGSSFDYVSAKHLVFWRGAPGPLPRGPLGEPTSRPVVRGQRAYSPVPLTVHYQVTAEPIEPLPVTIAQGPPGSPPD